jgi:hypothetical protein
LSSAAVRACAALSLVSASISPIASALLACARAEEAEVRSGTLHGGGRRASPYVELLLHPKILVAVLLSPPSPAVRRPARRVRVGGEGRGTSA